MGGKGAEVTGIVATINLDNPPETPPSGCVDPAVWRLAWSRFNLHRAGADGVCTACQCGPCSGRALAAQGLATAMGLQAPLSSYWMAFAFAMRNPAHVQAVR